MVLTLAFTLWVWKMQKFSPHKNIRYIVVQKYGGEKRLNVLYCCKLKYCTIARQMTWATSLSKGHKCNSFNPGYQGKACRTARHSPFYIALQQLCSRLNKDCHRAWSDKSLMMVENLEVSSLSTLYDLNHSISQGVADRVFKYCNIWNIMGIVL